MASTFQFGEDNGAAIHVPTRGTTRTTGVTQVNFKNTDDVSTTYSTSPITAGNNSYEKFQWGLWTGSFNEITNVKFNHTSGVYGAGLTLKFYPSGTGMYSTPATTTNALLLHDLTSTGLVSTGLAIRIGINGPEHTGKGTSSNGTVVYTEYLASQLQTSVAASPGDTALIGLTIQWDES